MFKEVGGKVGVLCYVDLPLVAAVLVEMDVRGVAQRIPPEPPAAKCPVKG